MNVYKIVPTKSYTYGCALVAANSVEEAIRIYTKFDEYNDFIYDDYCCTCEKVDKLNSDVSVPTIVLDTIGES